MSEEDFDSFSCFQKVKVLSKKLRNACNKNSTLPILFMGSAIQKLYYVMFNTFWLLYLLSYEGVYYDEKGAQHIYAQVMMCSVIFGIIVTPIVGVAVDRVSPKKIIPFSFAVRAASIVCFMFVEDPSGWYSYLCAVFMVTGTACEQITIDAIILRSAEREIRGVIYGFTNACVQVGTFLFTLGGGFLYDYVGPKSPFVVIGVLDFTFAVTVVFLACAGYVRDDIAERKQQQEQIKESLRRLKSGEKAGTPTDQSRRAKIGDISHSFSSFN